MGGQAGQVALLHSQSLTDQEGLTATDDLTRDPTAWCPGVGGDLREVGLLLAPLHSGSANSGHVGWYSTHSLYPGKAPSGSYSTLALQMRKVVALIINKHKTTCTCRALNPVHFLAHHHCHPVLASHAVQVAAEGSEKWVVGEQSQMEGPSMENERPPGRTAGSVSPGTPLH